MQPRCSRDAAEPAILQVDVESVTVRVETPAAMGGGGELLVAASVAATDGGTANRIAEEVGSMSAAQHERALGGGVEVRAVEPINISTAPADDGSGGGSAAGALIGGVAAAALVLCVCGGCVCLYKLGKRAEREKQRKNGAAAGMSRSSTDVPMPMGVAPMGEPVIPMGMPIMQTVQEGGAVVRAKSREMVGMAARRLSSPRSHANKGELPPTCEAATDDGGAQPSLYPEVVKL